MMSCLYNSPAFDSSLGGGVFYNYRMPIDNIRNKMITRPPVRAPGNISDFLNGTYNYRSYGTEVYQIISGSYSHTESLPNETADLLNYY